MRVVQVEAAAFDLLHLHRCRPPQAELGEELRLGLALLLFVVVLVVAVAAATTHAGVDSACCGRT